MVSMMYQVRNSCSLKHEIFDYTLDIRNFNDMKGNFIYSVDFRDMCKKLIANTNYSQFTEFEKALLFKILPYNKMKVLGLKGKYKFDFSNETPFGLFDDYSKYYPYTVSLEDFKMIYKVYQYKYLNELNLEYSVDKFIDKDFCDNYYQLEDENLRVQTTNYYGMYKHILKTGIVEVIDKGDYIMFFKTNSKKFHLERTDDNDIEWRDFDKAFERIFEIYCNTK